MPPLNRRKFLKSAVAVTAASVAAGCSQRSNLSTDTPVAQGSSVMGLTVPAMEVVRVGFIGVGQRGSGHVKHFCHLEGVEIKAICDTDEKNA